MNSGWGASEDAWQQKDQTGIFWKKTNKQAQAKDEDLNYGSNSNRSDWKAGRDQKFKEFQWIGTRESERRIRATSYICLSNQMDNETNGNSGKMGSISGIQF